MSDRLTRAHRADLHVRTDPAGGRTLYGLCVPFDEETTIAEGGRRYVEVFRRGSFARTIAERGDKVKLLVQHDRTGLPIGRAVLLREDAAGLYGEFHVSATRAGDEVLELVTDGALDAFSVGFRSIAAGDRWNRERTRVERTEVALAEVSVVAWGAYSGAAIEGVRSAVRTLPVEAARRRLDLYRRSIR